MLKVTIIIPVHNELKYTQNCLMNLVSQISTQKVKEILYSIIVIDDGSTDGTSVWIKENYPEVILIIGDGNLWWSGGVNKGAKYAIEQMNVDYVLLWNNDIIALENYFENLALAIITNQKDERSIVGSKIYVDYKSKLVWSLGGCYNSKTGEKCMIGYYQFEKDISHKINTINWLPGMGTLVPVNIILEIGYWDEINFPQYFGDSEFTLRAANKGFKIKVLENLIIENDITNTTIKHHDSYSKLLRTFYDKKSLFNIKYQINFYRRFSTSPFAYWYLLMSYFRYIGGFFKWKFLKFIGIKKIVY